MAFEKTILIISTYVLIELHGSSAFVLGPCSVKYVLGERLSSKIGLGSISSASLCKQKRPMSNPFIASVHSSLDFENGASLIAQAGGIVSSIAGATSFTAELALPAGSLAVGLLYLTSPPGVGMGLIDAVTSKFDQSFETTWAASDLTSKVGKLLGKGTFGTAYEGFPSESGLKKLGGKDGRVVLKRVADERQADIETYFNRRVNRLSTRDLYAAFLGPVKVSSGVESNIQARGDGRLLIWRYEGSRTLESYLEDRNFPFNLEEKTLGRVGKEGDEERRATAVIQRLMSDIFRAIEGLHSAGIVHRDIKPANLLVADAGTRGPPLRLLDFGAAVDLRTGFNYEQERGFLDPRYGPPEQYVVPQSVSIPRTPLVAVLTSSLRWARNAPDRFDIYSAGVTFLQMAIPQLRTASNLRNFNSQLGLVGGDLEEWRRRYASKYDTAILDRAGGAGWDLARRLVAPRAARLSAAAARRHRFFGGW